MSKRKTPQPRNGTGPKANTKKSSDNKTMPTNVSVDEFIAAVDNQGRRDDALHLLSIFEEITKQPAKMWGPSIIGFGQYHYKYDSGREGDTLCVGFSQRKANMVLYVLGMIEQDDPDLEKLGPHKTGSACLYVGRLKGVDEAALRSLIKKSYERTIKKYRD